MHDLAAVMPEALRTTLALLSGPLLAAVLYVLLPTDYASADGVSMPLSEAARGTLALTACMAVWWLFEALPVAATALVPVPLFPLFGLHRLEAVAAAYAHPLIFLFFGGFLLSIAIEKWRLHTWIAARVIAVAGSDPRRLVGAFMLVTAATSMWLSNTATALMMLPIAASAIAALDRASGAPQPTFAICLLLGVAYGASIGGMGTLIGSPPNLFVASFLAERFGYVLDFRSWMTMALPLVVVLLPLVWWSLTRILVPVDPALRVTVTETRVPWRALAGGARRVSWVFLATVTAWMFRSALNDWTVYGRAPLAALTDSGIALAAALLLFALPAGDGTRLLAWGMPSGCRSVPCCCSGAGSRSRRPSRPPAPMRSSGRNWPPCVRCRGGSFCWPSPRPWCS